MELTQETGIYVKPNGRLYVRATATDPKTGKIVERKRTLPKNAGMDEAIRVRDQLKRRIETGEATSTKPLPENVRTYSERWIQQKAATGDGLTANSERRYRDALAWCNVRVGDIRLASLTRDDVVEWVQWVEGLRQPSGAAYATATLRGWWRVISQMLKDAHADGLIASDVTYRVASPKTGRRNVREEETLSGKQLAALLRMAKRRGTRYAEIATLAFTGMRPGELYALDWKDIDLDRNVIHIRDSISGGEKREGTKTGDPRTHGIHPELRSALLEHRGDVPRIGLVFPSDAGTPRYASSLYKELDRCARLAEIDQKVRPQVLRRTFNTLMQAAGVPTIVLQAMMGHSSDSMTELYTGVRHEQKLEALEMFGEMVGCTVDLALGVQEEENGTSQSRTATPEGG